MSSSKAKSDNFGSTIQTCFEANHFQVIQNSWVEMRRLDGYIKFCSARKPTFARDDWITKQQVTRLLLHISAVWNFSSVSLRFVALKVLSSFMFRLILDWNSKQCSHLPAHDVNFPLYGLDFVCKAVQPSCRVGFWKIKCKQSLMICHQNLANIN